MTGSGCTERQEPRRRSLMQHWPETPRLGVTADPRMGRHAQCESTLMRSLVFSSQSRNAVHDLAAGNGSKRHHRHSAMAFKQ
jgi:hypothetical protein